MKKKKYGTYTLSFLSGFILIYVILSGNLSLIYPNSEWGFAGQMPALYWVGFITFLASFSFLLRHDGSEPSSTQCFLWLVSLIAYWNVYIFIQPTPIRPDAYVHFADAFRLSEKGRITAVKYGMGGWPGLFILGYALSSVTGLPPISFLRAYPMITSSVLVFSVFLVAKRLFCSNLYGLISATLALLGNIGLQFIFTPHSLAAALLPFLFLIFCAKKRRNSILIMTIYVGIVTIYGLFSIYFAVLVLSIGVMTLLLKRMQETYKSFILLVITVLLAYMIFNAQFGIERGIFTLKVLLLSPPAVPTYMEAASSDLVFPTLAFIRGGLLFIYLIGGILATIYLLKTMPKYGSYRYAFLIFMNAWGILFLLISPYLRLSLPNIRSWYLITLSSSLSAPILVSRVGRIKRATHLDIKYLSVTLIILLGVTGFIAFHTYDAYLVAPISELRATRFIAEHWEGFVIFDGSYPSLPIEFYKPKFNFTHEPFSALKSITLLDSSRILVTKHTSYSYYFLNGRVDEYNHLQMSLKNVPCVNKIYDSSTLQVFTGSHASYD